MIFRDQLRLQETTLWFVAFAKQSGAITFRCTFKIAALFPQLGAHCGQQRLIFTNNVPIGNGRMFMILEAQIPNPHPECGVAACRSMPRRRTWSCRTSSAFGAMR